MAVGEYLKTAAAYLSRASQGLLKDANDTRSQITLKEQEVRRQVDELRAEMRRKEAELTDTNQDNYQRADVLRETQQIESQISTLERDLNGEKARLESDAAEMEQQAQDIKSQADDLMNQAAGS